MKERGFKLGCLEVNAGHNDMISMVLPIIFDFFNRHIRK
jgi:hypothetical protein